MKTYHFIVNPTASSGKGAAVWQRMEALLKKENITYEVHVPESGEAVTALVHKLTGQKRPYTGEDTVDAHMEAAAALEEYAGEGNHAHMCRKDRDEVHLVVVGGDGTLNKVLQGIEDFEHTVISCISTGSGNDFARNMHISGDAEQSLWQLLHAPEETIIDYGIATYRQADGSEIVRRFLISSGVGYDADICEEVGRSRLKPILNRIRLGRLVYVAIGIKQIFTRTVTRVIITMDEKKPMKLNGLFFVVGMIHQMEGGGVPFCPHADAADGMLDICLVRDMPKWKLLLAVMLVYRKKHLLFRRITEHRCQRISIRTERPQWFHIDGDAPCQVRELMLECKSGLRFVG